MRLAKLKSLHNNNIINIIILLLFGFSLGFDKYFSCFFNFEILKAVPSISLISTLYIFANKSSLQLKNPSSFNLIFILISGLLISLLRYYFKYSENGFTWLPIVRQSVSWTIGIFIYLSFLVLNSKQHRDRIFFIFTFTSIPFLLVGIYQLLSGQIIGFYPRVTSLFSEPSYFGDYLILLIGPCILIQVKKFDSMSKIFKVIILLIVVLWMINIFAAQSGTAVLKLISFITLYIFLSKYKLTKKILSLFLSFLFVGIVIYLKPNLK